MVKKGEFIDFAVGLATNWEDASIDKEPTLGKTYLDTNTSIIVELALKVKELEAVIADLTTRITELEKKVGI